ncbi:TPR repeat-containing protein ZIP4 isoform X2 [Phalaenopsis equestris]|uniref:TPR repeat-containing protein ZIP4 isoform X2 n=1 Tax=Phalaenopsis equestris TaxID=78828 RepID=UPI0009E320D9|nr:TPR repeat-containing protein ZIP4 isoform X2 [Phalaenopsis equestris]
MRISELSPELCRPPADGDSQSSRLHVFDEIESSVNEAESLTFEDLTSLENLVVRLRKSLSSTTSTHPLSDLAKLHAWKLSYRLWNACVDLANASDGLRTVDADYRDRTFVLQAELRQIAAEILLLAKNPKGIPSPDIKSASFFHKAGLIWHDLGRFNRAVTNFEHATDLISSSRADGEDEKRLLLDLNLARARTAWEANDRSLSIALLGRSKNILFGSQAGFQALAEQYLQFGKLSLKNSSDGLVDASKLLSESLELCEKGIAISTGGSLELERLKARCLRFMAAERLQAEDYEGVLNCVRVSRGIEGKEEHPSIRYMAMKACIGAGRLAEAEMELRGLIANKSVPETTCISAVETFLTATGAAEAKEIMMMLLGRCRSGAAAALRVVKMVAESGSCAVRTRVAAELASDDRVVALFIDNSSAKERNAMHALLWNWGAERFRSKEYDISAELFEKSMLYVPRDENRARRSNCFRVLSLCHLALVQLDLAQEFIDQAEKLEPNLKCSFLKFKIQLQKRDEAAAISQIEAMVSCIDFNPEFLTLCTHEAIACQSFPVAVASLSILLNLYSSGKPMPMKEVAVFRNLITLLHRDLDGEQEMLKHTRRAWARVNELGTENFFGTGAVGARELNWFAGNTWNMGLKMVKDKKYEICAEFFELAAEFYDSCSDKSEGKQAMVCKSLILCTGAMIHAEEEKKISMTDSDVKRAIEILQRAEKLVPTMHLSTAVTGDWMVEASTMCFLHTFNTYQLLNRLDDTRNQQLQLVKRFASTKACNPNSLLQIGLFASQGRRPNTEVSEFAFRKCLSSLLELPTPDYQMVSMVLRWLISIACLCSTENGGKNEAAYTLYRQAYQIIVGLKEGEYPVEEGKWLAMTAWNRSGTAVRLRQVNTARKWMKMGLDLAKRISGMEKYLVGMEESFTNFEEVCRGNDSGAVYSY